MGKWPKVRNSRQRIRCDIYYCELKKVIQKCTFTQMGWKEAKYQNWEMGKRPYPQNSKRRIHFDGLCSISKKIKNTLDFGTQELWTGGGWGGGLWCRMAFMILRRHTNKNEAKRPARCLAIQWRKSGTDIPFKQRTKCKPPDLRSRGQFESIYSIQGCLLNQTIWSPSFGML